MRIALTGRHERMSAQRAYELGMISEVVAHDQPLERGKEVAALVNRNAPLAVRGTRLAIRKGLDLPLHEAEILAETFRERVVRTDDAREGPAAFVEKRTPKWSGTMSAADPAAFETIRYEISDDHVATITLDRPEVLNAFDRQMCHEMREAWRLVKDDPCVHMRWSCGPRGTEPSAPASTRRSRTGNPTTCGTTKTPVSS